MKYYFVLIVLLLWLTPGHSQDKLEREYRVKTSEVPVKALEYVNSSFENVKMKWYGEENLNGKAIEAKGKRDGKLYSVKFSTSGQLQDIEMVVKFNSIPENTRTAIEMNLNDRFSRYRIQKTQIQWVGNNTDLAALIKGEKVLGTYSTNYEITLLGTKGSRSEYYEVLANQKGAITRESKIIQRNNNNLIY